MKVLGPNLIGFADFKGNRQLLSTGNLDVTDRVALFMMDYPNRKRLKLLGHARVLDACEHPALIDQLAPNRCAARSSGCSSSRSSPTTGTARNTSPRASPRRRSRNMPPR